MARSLDSARLRAESRLQRFLDAALELIEDGGPGKDFTVQEVVERSGQSLRLFYQYFGGKHELLLALFEESVRSTTEFLRTKIAEEDDALERLHRFVVEYYRLCRPGPDPDPVEWTPTGPMMVDFAQQLLTSHPTEAALAFAPLVSLFGEVLDEAAAAAGHPARAAPQHHRRHGPRGHHVQRLLRHHRPARPGRTAADPAEELWDLILHGVGATGPAPEKGRTATKDRRP